MIAIVQPHIPHYRDSFFKLLQKRVELDLYCYSKVDNIIAGFGETNIKVKDLGAIEKGPILTYNPMSLLSKKYSHLVLMLHFGHLTTWLLLLTKVVHRKKIVLWGQGISVKRYLQEEKAPDWKLKLMIWLSDGVWLYTEKEANQWKAIFPSKPVVALNNTLYVPEYIKPTLEEKIILKQKYNIKQEKILIFCARFENPYRRTDLLLEVIKQMDPEKFGFIIIGEGSLKPDFTPFVNVYDFGRLYDDRKKGDLFSLSDIYFQPGWVGLSIVEAMAYGLPVFTFKRCLSIKQCVEYSYIQDGHNGMLFGSLESFIKSTVSIKTSVLNEMGNNARSLVNYKLTLEGMVERALAILGS